MKIRAKQNTQIQTDKGPVFVSGPILDENDVQLGEGQVIDVPDDFLVNTDIFEFVRVEGEGNQQRVVVLQTPPKGARIFKPKAEQAPAGAAN